MTSILVSHHGSYAGSGEWRDDAGGHHRYDVTLTLEARTGGLGLTFRHVFPEEPDQPDVNFDVTLEGRAPSILAFDLGGLAGRGFWDDDTGLLHYAIPIPGNLVEATYRFHDGGCLVAGSSEKNAAGHYIMWTETLARR